MMKAVWSGVAATPGGDVYLKEDTGSAWTQRGHIPASDPIVDISGNTYWSGGAIVAVTEAGDIYVSADAGLTWFLGPNVFAGSPVQLQRETWGGVKERFSR